MWRRADSFMCGWASRTVLTGASIRRHRRLAAGYGGGYAHATTRANLQIREIEATTPHHIEAVQDLGLCSRGSGADNIRNVTG